MRTSVLQSMTGLMSKCSTINSQTLFMCFINENRTIQTSLFLENWFGCNLHRSRPTVYTGDAASLYLREFFEDKPSVGLDVRVTGAIICALLPLQS